MLAECSRSRIDHQKVQVGLFHAGDDGAQPLLVFAQRNLRQGFIQPAKVRQLDRNNFNHS